MHHTVSLLSSWVILDQRKSRRKRERRMGKFFTPVCICRLLLRFQESFFSSPPSFNLHVNTAQCQFFVDFFLNLKLKWLVIFMLTIILQNNLLVKSHIVKAIASQYCSFVNRIYGFTNVDTFITKITSGISFFCKSYAVVVSEP